MPVNEDGQIMYGEFLALLNWRDNPVAPLPQKIATGDANWQGNSANSQIQNVNIAALVQDLTQENKG